MNFNFFLDILYFILFLAFCVISFKLLLDSNLEKCFKQGKVRSIQVCYVFLSIVLSFLAASAVTKLISTAYNILINF